MANKTQIILTKSVYEQLESEYRHLIDVERPDVIEKLKLAREQGDLSENADYDAARERQAQIESRITEIEGIFNNAVMADSLESSGGNKVSIGDIVVLAKEDGSQLTVRVSGNVGADPLANPPTVSNESPIGKAILGQKLGSTVRVECANPYNVTIKEVDR